MCRFATTCSFAYANHMMGFHAGKGELVKTIVPNEKAMEEVMYCLCGWSSQFGNSLGRHFMSLCHHSISGTITQLRPTQACKLQGKVLYLRLSKLN